MFNYRRRKGDDGLTTFFSSSVVCTSEKSSLENLISLSAPKLPFQRFAGLEFGAGVGKVEVLDPCDSNTNGDAAQDEYEPIRESVV